MSRKKTDSEILKARRRARYAANRETILARIHAYRDTHQETIAAQKKVHYQATKAVRAEAMRKYREANRAVLAANDKRYRDAHAEERAMKQKARYEGRKQLVIAAYGGQCVCCGEAEPAFLTLDHVKGDGAAHRKELGRRTAWAWAAANAFPPTLQLLCYNCNLAKRTAPVCPHVEIRRTRS